jgi:hypothetical protein
MNKSFANFLSVLAHPVFINLLCLYTLFFLYPPLKLGLPQRVQLFYISFIFISTGVVPILVVFVMRIMGKIKSIRMEDSDDRKVPYLVTLSLYVFNFYNLAQSATTHPIILRYLIACSLILAIVLFINFIDKISIHLATLGAFVGLIAGLGIMGFADLRFPMLLSIMLAGLIASARLSLSAHLPRQLYSGFAIGFIIMFLSLILDFKFS